MTGITQRIEDGDGREIVVGTKVIYGAPLSHQRADHRATVIEIGEYDIDHDDDLGRARMFPPKVKIRFDIDQSEEEVSSSEITQLGWGDYPDGPTQFVFCADDLEVEPLTPA